MTAQYLLRFDDLCPTMDGARWERFEPLLRRFGIRPILAVVPDNQDPDLQIGQPDPKFWEKMRTMQAEGATIGLHGYQHVCEAEGRGLVPVHRRTEFAGAPRDCQQEWIRAGLRILRGHGLEARIWVAPRHGLDRRTLWVLREEGIGLVSDGFARRPFKAGGLTWIPQQLWGPGERGPGLWTICVHANVAADEVVEELEAFVARRAAQFTSVERVLAEWAIGQRSMADRVFHQHMLMRIRLGRWRRR
jgi:predicted deacetylase